MIAIDENELQASFKELEVNAEARRKEEEAAAARKRKACCAVVSTPSMRPGGSYTTKSGAVNSAWGGIGALNHVCRNAWRPTWPRKCDPDSADAL
jgi:hypothetical protein